MDAFAKFERSLIREGRITSITPKQMVFLKEQIDLGVPKSKLFRNFSISRPTLYQYLNQKNQL